MASEAGIPAVICNGTGPGTLRRGRGRRRVGTRFAAQAGRDVELQALAQIREAGRGPDRRRRRRRRGSCARAARACCRSASPRSTGSFEAGDAVDVAERGRADRQRASATTPPRELAQVIGMKTDAGPRACSRTPPTRSSTATASSCSRRRPAPSYPVPMAVRPRPASPRPAPPRSGRRGRWRAPRPRPRTPPWRRPRGCSRSARAEILEANAADLADERAAGLTEALRDRLTLTAGAGRGDGRGRARRRRARRSGRRGARTQDAGQRASTCARSGCRSGSSPSSTRRART